MKFSQPIADGIIKDIANGVPYKISCESFGISYSTFRSWLQNATRDQNEGKETIYTQFLSSLRNVQKNIISNHVSAISESDKGHKGKEWILERSYWQYFSSKAAEMELNERVEALEQKKVDENENKTTRSGEEERQSNQENSTSEEESKD
jgi:hypothetical protein